jgi:hypothetical protein
MFVSPGAFTAACPHLRLFLWDTRAKVKSEGMDTGLYGCDGAANHGQATVAGTACRFILSGVRRKTPVPGEGKKPALRAEIQRDISRWSTPAE